LFTAGVPDPDLIIRTSGELRVSNFLIWQAAYSEWYITPTFWPDFDKDEYRRALESFATATGVMERYLRGNFRNPMRRRLITALGLAANRNARHFIWRHLLLFIDGHVSYRRSWEYVHLFRAVKFEPQMHITVGGVALVTLRACSFPDLHSLPLPQAMLLAMAYHLYDYERGRDQSALDFAITVGGITYIGWIGSYLLDLRNLPEGGWWFMLVMFCVWSGDSGAYSIGRAYGKHKMAPRLSPKKSWEGYAASVFTGMITGAFYVYVFQTFGNLTSDITIWQGAILGLLLGSLPPLGDLGREHDQASVWN
jgi:CDP-diglyceride synthetase